MSLIISEHLSDEPTGAICVLGRGIERVSTRWGVAWRPTRYVEQPSERGGHSGSRHPAAANDATALIAGGNVNLLATCTLFKRLHLQGAAPGLVIFAAGRPAYLAEGADPALSEGSVLKDSFIRRLGLHARETEMIILTENRDTHDDIKSTITLAAQRRIAQVGLITVRVHIARAMEFSRQVRNFEKPVRLAFIAAEDLLRERYSKHPCILRAIEDSRTSAAYARTAVREEHGVQALRAGTYWKPR